MDTYEKKYKEALERAKEQLETAKVFDYKEGQIAHDIRTITYAIFPELKEESEDEKIERILHSISSKMSLHLCDTFTEEEFQYFDTWSNAWLEKQGKIDEDLIAKKFLINKGYPIDANGTFPTYEELYNIIREGLENQSEQKLTDEPKFKVKYAGSEYNVLNIKEIAGVTYYVIEDEPNHIDYVKADNCEIISSYAIKESGSPNPTKPAVFSEQKSVDKVEPKFKVGDEIKTANGESLTITKIDEKGYWSEDLFICGFGDAAKWELVGKSISKIDPKFHKGDWVVVSTIKGDRVVQIASVEYLKDGYPSYITTEGRWFGNGTKARLLTDKDVEIATIPESKIVVSKSRYWSEEDEHWRQKAIDFMKHPDLIKATPTLAKNTIDWLKSLKERYTWKPSDEQITVLELASKYERVFTPKQIDILIGLKEQLKKLKKEEV